MGTVLVFLISLFLVTLNFIFVSRNSKGNDFLAFFTAVKIYKDFGGDYLYDLDLQIKIQDQIEPGEERGFNLPFIYPPPSILFFMPLSGLDPKTAFVLASFSTFLFILSYYLALGRNFGNFGIGFLPLFLLIFYWPNINVILLPQPFVILSAWSLLLTYIFIKQKKHFFAGSALGLLLFKPQFLPAALFFLPAVSEKLKFIKGFLQSAAIFIFLSFYLGGANFIASYIEIVKKTDISKFGNRYEDMFSLYPSLNHLISKNNDFNLLAILFLLLPLFLYFVFFFSGKGQLLKNLFLSHPLLQFYFHFIPIIRIFFSFSCR
jgi:hypothetical protein